ncbi:MAG: hypothetical protein QOE82_786 [Thermoanaerobaculia bacterium]|jgi:hypothetical protein|nr:hypothetical protein [Thermoanaerobaculia bacterium]
MRRLAATLSAFLLVPATALAFEGIEHRDLSNAALRLAIAHVKTRNITVAEAIDAFASDDAVAKRHSFGDLTSAVDWFEDTDGLIRPDAFDRIRERRRLKEAPKRWKAVHKNGNHFQRAALKQYTDYHEIALKRAREHKLEAALHAEGVALHFIEDFFSAGHLITPRNHLHNYAAGDLHDLYNQRGIWFTIAPGPAAEEGTQRTADLMKTMRAFRIGSPSVRAVDVTADDSKAFDDFLAPASSADHGLTQFYGDDYLEQTPLQKVFLLTVCAMSIVEIFDADAGTPETAVQTCFDDAGAQASGSMAKDDTVTGPEGGVRFVTAAKEHFLGTCLHESGWFGRYTVSKDPRTRLNLYPIRGWQALGMTGVAYHSRGWRHTAEVGNLLFGSDDSQVILDEKKERTNKRLNGGASLAILHFGTIQGAEYTANSMQFEVRFAPQRDFTWSVLAGGTRYRSTFRRATSRLEYGVRFAYGFEVVNAVIGVSRGHEFSADGRFHHDYFIEPGIELIVSRSWLRFRRRHARKVAPVAPAPALTTAAVPY